MTVRGIDAASTGDGHAAAVRRVRVGLLGIGLGLAAAGGVFAAAFAAPPADPPGAYAATAAITESAYYLGDAAGSIYTFTVRNTGTTATIGAVEITRPSTAGWTVTACPGKPAGWTDQRSDPKCRFRSANGTVDDILPGQSRTFTVRATTTPGTSNRSGTWTVVVSKSNQFDNPSLLKNATPATAGALTTTLYTFELTDAVVTSASPAAGSACPAANKEAVTGSTQNIVICGRNRATTALTPVASQSSLGGTFVASPGTFSSGSIPASSGNVVLARWTGMHVTGTYGIGTKTVIAKVGSSSTRTSPLTTFTGYSATNQPPDANDDSYSGTEDTPLVVSAATGVLANDTDPEGDPLTALLDTDVSHGDLTLNSDGSFTYTPDPDYFGPDFFTYEAYDGLAYSAPATVDLTVTGVEDAPVAYDDTPTVSEDSTGDHVDVLANDVDVDLDTLAVTSVNTSGTQGQVTSNGTDVTYDPDGKFEYLTDGQTATDVFAYTVSDGHGGTDTATVTVTIEGVNDAPVAVNDSYNVDEDDSLVGAAGVLTNDSDAEGAVTAQLDQDVSNGDLTLNPDGSFSYVPDANFYGTDSFTYFAVDGDGALSDPATVDITVDSVNDAPVANDDTPTVSEDSTGDHVDVLANDTDVDLDTLAVTSVDAGSTDGLVTSNGTDVTYDPDGKYEYLDDGETATDTFTYLVSDGHGGTDTATVTVTIEGVNDPPVATADSYQATTAEQLSVSAATGLLANDTDAESDPLTVPIAGSASHGTIDVATDGSFTYTSAADFTGDDVVTYTVSDGDLTDSSTVTIHVVPPNAAPVATDVTPADYAEDSGAHTVTLTATDADADPLTYSVVTGPAHGTLGTVTGNTVDYTPAANYNGTDSFTFKANDTHVDSNTATVHITVTPVNDAPSFVKGGNQTVAEDSGEATVTDWATAISPGPADESGQTVSFVLTTNNDALFAVLPAVSATGTLTYTPAVDAFGSATVTIHAHDSAGADSGNQTFSITVTAVNDTPSFTAGDDQTVNEDAGAQSVSNWATDISPGPANESGQTVEFILTNDNPGLFSAAPAISAAGTLTYTSAANKYGVANLTVKIKDSGGGADTSATQPLVITVNAVNDAPVAAAKSYTVQTNMRINLGDLLLGATDPNDVAGNPSWTPTFTVGSITPGVGCTGCTVSNVDAAAGTFDFDPPAGQAGSFTMTYTVVDNGEPGAGATSAAQTITLTVSGPVIWFVDPAAGNGGTGRLSAPFDTLSDVTAVDSANHRVFVKTGSVTDGIALTSGEWLTGSGAVAASFDALMGITPPVGTMARPAVNTTAPSIAGSVTLGTGNTLRGLRLTGAPALTGSGFGTLTLGSGAGADVVTNTTGQALSLTTGTVSGDFAGTTSSGGTNNVLLSGVSSSGTSLGSGALSGATAEGFKVSGGAGTFTYSGTVANATGTTVSIASMTGGGVTLSGAVSDTAGAGVALSSNTGATINLTGGVNLTSGTSAAFAATGGGTVTVTGTSNTLSSTTGTPLNIANTTIGASGVTFRSIGASGAANGVVLDTTGSAGVLTVTGTGSAGTGGTIANATGDAIRLNSTQAPSFNWMSITSPQQAGVQGSRVHGFTMTHTTISGAGAGHTDVEDYALSFNDTAGGTNDNLDGTVVITDNSLTGAYGGGIHVFNYSGTIDNATVTGNTLTSSTDAAQSKGTGIAFDLFGSSTTVANMTKGSISNNTVTNFPSGNGIRFQGGNSGGTSAGTYGTPTGTPGTGTNIITIGSNQIAGDATTFMNAMGIAVSVAGRGVGNFAVTGNGTLAAPIAHTKGSGIGIGGAGAVTVDYSVTGNYVNGSDNWNGSDTIGLGTDTQIVANPTTTLTNPLVRAIISNNTVVGSSGFGIRALSRDSNGTTLLKMQNNSVTGTYAFNPIDVTSGSTGSATFNPTVCTNISGNTTSQGAPAFGSNVPGITIEKYSTSASTYLFGLVGLSPSPTTAANTENYLASQNPASALGSGAYAGKRAVVFAGDNFTSCTLAF